MKKKQKSKEQIIKDRLFRYGKISRNWVLKNLFYTHLNDVIYRLRYEGHLIDGQFEFENRTGDYIYHLCNQDK